MKTTVVFGLALLLGACGPALQREDKISVQGGWDGRDGRNGAAGLQGPEGRVGPQGTPGVAGQQGAQGPAGPTGSQGPQGEAGPAGQGCTLDGNRDGGKTLNCGGGTSIDLPAAKTITICLWSDGDFKTKTLADSDFISDYYGQVWYWVGACACGGDK